MTLEMKEKRTLKLALQRKGLEKIYEKLTKVQLVIVDNGK
jgi:hypothetical protein